MSTRKQHNMHMFTFSSNEIKSSEDIIISMVFSPKYFILFLLNTFVFVLIELYISKILMNILSNIYLFNNNMIIAMINLFSSFVNGMNNSGIIWEVEDCGKPCDTIWLNRSTMDTKKHSRFSVKNSSLIFSTS